MSYTKMCKTFKGIILDILVKTGINTHKYPKDKYVLDIVTNGLRLEPNELPCQYSKSNYPLSTKVKEVIFTEIKKLLSVALENIMS